MSVWAPSVWLYLFISPYLVCLFLLFACEVFCFGTGRGLVLVVKLEAVSLLQEGLLHSDHAVFSSFSSFPLPPMP